MRSIVLSSLVLSAFFAVTGCSVSSQPIARTPSRTIDDTSSDPSWNPPDEVQFTATELKGARSMSIASGLPTPRHAAIAHGQVHAAY